MANIRNGRMTDVSLDLLRCDAAVFVAALPFAANSLTPAQTPIKVLLVTGQSNRYHNWEVSSPIVKRWLEASRRFVVTVATTDEADVDLAADERVDLIGRRHVPKMELDVWMGAPKFSQHVRKQAEDAGDTKSYAEESCFASSRPLCDGNRRRCLADEMPAAGGEEPAGVRESHIAIPPNQERTPDSFFEAAEPFAQGWLGNVQPLGGTAEMKRVG